MKRFFALIIVMLLCLSVFGEEMALSVSANEWETYSSTWSLTDALGRTAEEATEESTVRKDKFVGIFYHIWHKDFMQGTCGADPKAPRNVSRIISENEDGLTKSSLFGPNQSYHYWGEPLFGYYDLSQDEYVIRKHAQMLTDAGIDAIIIDYSNYCVGGVHTESNYTKSSLTNLLNTYNKIREEGGDTPGVVFLLTWDASANAPAINHFWKDFYSKDEYKDLWFQWEGKPLILAQKEYVDPEIADNFTYRRPFPYYTPVDGANAWSWLSNYPQTPCYTETNPCEMVAVSVAQNWSTSLDYMSSADENGNYRAHGRSWTYGGENKVLNNPVSEEYGSEYGLNLQQQFDRAIELDPDMLFITGWNEWIAARFLQYHDWVASANDPVSPTGGFCDCFTTEFSRDCEPTREGNLGDNFYNQLVINIRRFKGTDAQVQSISGITANMDNSAKDFSPWDSVTSEYRDDVNDISIRNAKGIGKNKYTNDTGRNDFKIMKATCDDSNIYFYAETVSDITPFTDSDWMNLFISVNSSDSSWEGFNYVINRTNVRDGVTTLEKSNGGWNWSVVSDDVKYVVSGNKIQIAVPLSDLGITDAGKIDINFKWADNVGLEGDYLRFYENGDTAPNSRFTYRFVTVPQNTSKAAKKGINLLAVAAASVGAVAIAAGALAAVILLKDKKK